MDRTLSEVRRYGADWDQKRKRVLRRDDYTCQRCGHQSGPHAGDEGRILQVHHVEKLSEGGSNDESNLVTLCRPCHGVQHPGNETFDEVRGYARIYPPSAADARVAYVNSKTEREPLDAYLDRKDSDHCDRCGDPRGDGERFYVYPNIDFGERGGYENPAEKFGVLCGPCTGLVYAADDDGGVEHRLRSTEGQVVGDAVDRLVDVRERALLSGTKKTRKFGATRDPVNLKERVLFASPYRYVHWFWRRLGALALAALCFVLLGPAIEGTTAWLSTPGAARTVAAGLPLPAFGPAAAEFYAFGGGLIAAVSLAFTIRWSVAALSDLVWDRVDPSLRRQHYRKPKLHTLRRRLWAVCGYLLLPYLAIATLLLAVTAL